MVNSAARVRQGCLWVLNSRGNGQSGRVRIGTIVWSSLKSPKLEAMVLLMGCELSVVLTTSIKIARDAVCWRCTQHLFRVLLAKRYCCTVRAILEKDPDTPAGLSVAGGYCIALYCIALCAAGLHGLGSKGHGEGSQGECSRS